MNILQLSIATINSKHVKTQKTKSVIAKLEPTKNARSSQSTNDAKKQKSLTNPKIPPTDKSNPKTH